MPEDPTLATREWVHVEIDEAHQRRAHSLDARFASIEGRLFALEQTVEDLQRQTIQLGELLARATELIGELTPAAQARADPPTGIEVSESRGELEVAWDRVPGLGRREVWDLTDPEDRQRARAFVERMADSPARTDALERIAAYEEEGEG